MTKGNEPEPRSTLNHLCSIDATAKRLGVSTCTVRRKIKSGVLKGVRVGRRVLVPESVIMNVIENGCGQ
jgi:excisionase family DNA binding protein